VSALGRDEIADLYYGWPKDNSLDHYELFTFANTKQQTQQDDDVDDEHMETPTVEQLKKIGQIELTVHRKLSVKKKSKKKTKIKSETNNESDSDEDESQSEFESGSESDTIVNPASLCRTRDCDMSRLYCVVM
jgi:hypothetical protein